jgi:beta-glucosidase
MPAVLAALLFFFLAAPQTAPGEPNSGAASPAGQTAAAPLTDVQVQQKVDSLMSQMMLEEKISQLAQVGGFSFLPGPKPEDLLRKGVGGSVLWVDDPATINRLQHIAVDESRLHIPVLFGLDVIHGYRTVFPVPLAMAASWDPELVEQAQAVAAREA